MRRAIEFTGTTQSPLGIPTAVRGSNARAERVRGSRIVSADAAPAPGVFAGFASLNTDPMEGHQSMRKRNSKAITGLGLILATAVIVAATARTNVAASTT